METLYGIDINFKKGENIELHSDVVKKCFTLM